MFHKEKFAERKQQQKKNTCMAAPQALFQQARLDQDRELDALTTALTGLNQEALGIRDKVEESNQVPRATPWLPPPAYIDNVRAYAFVRTMHFCCRSLETPFLKWKARPSSWTVYSAWCKS
jgi:hypothetical protein